MSGSRTLVAFLVAPLVMPLFSAISISFGTLLGGGLNVPYPVNAIIIATVAGVSYVISFLVGIPTYQFLVARQMTAFRIAPCAGAFVGFIGYWLGVVGLGSAARLATWTGALEALMLASLAALVGAAGGVIFWLIARPDRLSLSKEGATH